MKPFPDVRSAALALIVTDGLNRKTAQFVGQMSVEDTPTVKQVAWLQDLLRKADLPPLDMEARDAR